MRCKRWALALLFGIVVLSARAFAHPAVSAVATVKITRDGRLTITLHHDALAFALNELPGRIADAPMYAVLNGPVADLAAALFDGRERMESSLRVLADDSPVALETTESPTASSVERWKRENPGARLPVLLDYVFSADLPPRARALSVSFPPMLGEVILIVDRPGTGKETVTLPLRAGELSPGFDVADRSGEEATRPNTDAMGAADVVWRYVMLGFNHIIPDGPDHVLFVLGLFLLSPHVKPVLIQITFFTIAHTVTLTLTTLHVIGLPSIIVEPTIAASIAFIGIENLFTNKVHAWRPAVAFIFGLVHGMGVATAFNEAGFPPGKLVESLAAFTVGVESGHIAALGAAFLTLGRWRDRPWFRRRVTIPLSLLISAVAIFWMIQRLRG